VTAVQAGSLRYLLRRIVTYVVLSAAGALAVVYGGDCCAFHFRVATSRQPFGSVTVTRYYAVPQKNGKTEFLFDPSRDADVCEFIVSAGRIRSLLVPKAAHGAADRYL